MLVLLSLIFKLAFVVFLLLVRLLFDTFLALTFLVAEFLRIFLFFVAFFVDLFALFFRARPIVVAALFAAVFLQLSIGGTFCLASRSSDHVVKGR